jgi:hypothetical protein
VAVLLIKLVAYRRLPIAALFPVGAKKRKSGVVHCQIAHRDPFKKLHHRIRCDGGRSVRGAKFRQSLTQFLNGRIVVQIHAAQRRIKKCVDPPDYFYCGERIKTEIEKGDLWENARFGYVQRLRKGRLDRVYNSVRTYQPFQRQDSLAESRLTEADLKCTLLKVEAAYRRAIGTLLEANGIKVADQM